MNQSINEAQETRRKEARSFQAKRRTCAKEQMSSMSAGDLFSSLRCRAG